MSKDLGIDLGTTKIAVCVRGKGIVLQAPSVIATESASGMAVKFGEEAREMMGRTPRAYQTVRPVRDGVVSSYQQTVRMLQYYLRKVCGSAVIKPRVVVGTPCGASEVEQRALHDALISAGAKRVYLAEEPLLAALGAGLDISGAQGRMVVDIGGGTTDIAVISMNKIVSGKCLRTGGDEMNDALIRYLRRTYNLSVGERSAQDAKNAIGSVLSDDPAECTVKGICTLEGLPKSVKLTQADLKEALQEPCVQIVSAVNQVLESTPPELLSDIQENGILLSGGGANLKGLNTLIARATGYEISVAPEPQLCVAKGTERYWSLLAQ